MEARYPIRAVAKITGLSLDTLRAWERRYKAVVPERSERGRQYCPEHIERLLLLKQLVQKGHAIGTIATLPEEQLKNLLASQPQRSAEPNSPSRILDPVLTAIENFDPVVVEDELSRLAAVLSPRDLVYRVALPLMQEVGVRWHDGTFAVAQEHLVSQALRNLLGSMMRLFRTPDSGLKIVLATPAGEAHEFGVLAAAMLASMNGIEPIYLGPDLPAAEIAEAAGRVSARVILLGITVLGEATSDEVRSIAAAISQDQELWIGGAACREVNVSHLGRRVVLLNDLPALEQEFRRWRN